VTRNCLKCGKPDTVSEEELPTLVCDFCSQRLTVEKLDRVNYFYVCRRCKRNWQLSKVLPHWSELFEYCGLAAPWDVPR
jgi:DNA-directed RNA polymerase subunit RPC12/RpoP